MKGTMSNVLPIATICVAVWTSRYELCMSCMYTKVTNKFLLKKLMIMMVELDQWELAEALHKSRYYHICT